jgi:hypothetical protein
MHFEVEIPGHTKGQNRNLCPFKSGHAHSRKRLGTIGETLLDPASALYAS